MTDARRERLIDLGERRIIAELLAGRYGGSAPNFGDDAAIVIATDDGSLIATTDPAPRPVGWELGFQDYYHWGWLLAALNLSDIAACGGQPVGVLSSLTLPNEFFVDDLIRLLEGIDDCCTQAGTEVIGGNVKEAADGSTRCEATALGLVRDGAPFSRKGAKFGDHLLAFGPSGGFWSAICGLKESIDFSDADSSWLRDALLRPTAQVRIGRALHSAGLATACTDASDGLYAAIVSMTVAQGLGALLAAEEWVLPGPVTRAASKLKVDPIRLAFGFGDLQLVAAVSGDRVSDARALADEVKVHVLDLGRVVESPTLEIRAPQGRGRLANFDNERFSTESQFTGGLSAYMDRLLSRPLIVDES